MVTGNKEWMGRKSDGESEIMCGERGGRGALILERKRVE